MPVSVDKREGLAVLEFAGDALAEWASRMPEVNQYGERMVMPDWKWWREGVRLMREWRALREGAA